MSMRFHVLGIDPGFDGALSLLDSNGEEILRAKIPVLMLHKKKKKGQKTAGTRQEVDLGGLVSLIDHFADECAGSRIFVYLEKVSAAPDQGVSSMFRFGEVFGMIQGILAARRWPVDLIHPATWTKELHAGVSKEFRGKDRSRLVASRLWPTETFLRTEKCTKPDDGYIDARLIAEYGRRQVARTVV